MLNKHQENIDYELYLKISEGTTKSSLAMLLNMIVIFIAFFNYADIYFLSFWLAIGTFFLLVRSLDVYRYLTSPSSDTISLHARTFKIYSLLIATTVSSGIIILTPNNLPFHQAFLAMIVAGLSAGAVMALSYYQDLIRAYLVILILPFATLMLLQWTTIHILISFLMFLFLIMLILFSKKFAEAMMELIKSKNEAHTQAHYDTITGLANRLTLYDRLELEIQKIKRNKTQAAILFIDMDDFKKINDTYGHHVGDIVLKEFAKHLAPTTRTGDTLARLGGDEFVILLSNIETTSTKTTLQIAKSIAKKVHTLLEKPLLVGEEELTISVSIGIETIDEFTTQLDYILKNADTAMYEAKKQGKNQTAFFKG